MARIEPSAWFCRNKRLQLAQSGIRRNRFIHSSGSVTRQMRIISSMAFLIGIDLGIRIKPGQSLAVMNSPKCRGIVRTSCVTRMRPSDAATANTSKNLHTRRNNTLRQFEIDFRFAAKNTGDDILIKIGVGEETNPQPYLGRASSRARRSLLDRLSGSGDCLEASSCDKRSCSEKYSSTASLFAK